MKLLKWEVLAAKLPLSLGVIRIYISLSLPGKSSPKDWDLAAPEAILKGSGGLITDINNRELLYGKTKFEQSGILIASNNSEDHYKICFEVKKIIKEYDLYPLGL